MYANRHGYSDVEPFEIIRRISAKTMEVRGMSCQRDPTWKMDFVPGGFLGHVANQETQKWIISSDNEARIVRIRLRKDGRWYDSYGSRYVPNDKPIRFYDYNF